MIDFITPLVIIIILFAFVFVIWLLVNFDNDRLTFIIAVVFFYIIALASVNRDAL